MAKSKEELERYGQRSKQTPALFTKLFRRENSEGDD